MRISMQELYQTQFCYQISLERFQFNWKLFRTVAVLFEMFDEIDFGNKKAIGIRL